MGSINLLHDQGVNSNFHKNTGFIMIVKHIHFLIAIRIRDIDINHPQMCACCDALMFKRARHYTLLTRAY